MKKRVVFSLASLSVLLFFLLSSFSEKEHCATNFLCPCHSQRRYLECCKPYHQGGIPENALALMRSRYSAYALMKNDYIIRTTHPKNPMYNINFTEWKDNIQKRYQNVRFEDLEILEFIDGEETAYVTFTAILKRDEENVSFSEKSTFLKVGDLWLYKEGAKIHTPTL